MSQRGSDKRLFVNQTKGGTSEKMNVLLKYKGILGLANLREYLITKGFVSILSGSFAFFGDTKR